VKYRALTALLPLLLVGAASAPAQLVNGRFTTSFYTFERFDTVGSSRTYLRAFQSVQLSVAQNDFSVNTYLQGAVNGSNQFGDNGNVRFYNLYFRWANIGKMLDLSLGRQAVYAGVGKGAIDGLTARARVWDNQITLTGYGGSTVNDEYTGVRKDWHDNLNLGGQVLTTLVPGARIGLSYMYRREKRDDYLAVRETQLGDSLKTYLTVPFAVRNESIAEQLGSADASWSYGRILTVYGRYDYDFNFKETSRGQGSVRVNVTDALALTGDYTYRKPQIAFNSIFSVFTLNSTRLAEGGVEYGFTPLLRVFGKLGVVSYTDTTSMTWTFGVNSGYGSASYSGSTGYAGQLESFSVQGAYPLFDRVLVPSLGVSWASYRLSAEDPKDNALAILAGATVRPTRNFSFDVQGQWMTNRLYDRDMRLQVKLMYWFAERVSLFSQEVN
jgi:hypothetical protein